MRLLTLFLTLVVAALLPNTLVAQTLSYDVAIQGVHPARVSFDAGQGSGVYRFGDAVADTVALQGQCASSECKLVGIDSALALAFKYTPTQLSGTLSLGDGRVLPLRGDRRHVEDAPLATGCGNDLWLRSWTSDDSTFILTLTQLPDDQIRGNFYDLQRNVSYTALGRAGERGFALAPTSSGRESTLKLELTGAIEASQAESLRGVLVRDSAKAMPISLALAENLALACMQEGGLADMVFPLSQNELIDVAIRRRVRRWWDVLQSSEAGDAGADTQASTAWFEPTRIDDQFLSGWIHLLPANGDPVSYPLIVDRINEKLIRSNSREWGGRRGRVGVRNQARIYAVAAHPLHGDAGFEAWAADESLDAFAVTPVGLSFGGAYHPVYGQLRWTEPYDRLPGRAALTDWLPTWLGGPPAHSADQ